ncbi:hypothetical protein [Sphingomonas sanxanigenens]|uniref:hypothetical protein n=1 Tax=Sphingomonas sanxanigenens TaxID=397260 RepID=UPI0013013877|nr:hypothetical protein [Sphingomonas sanxanigenens]
MTDNMPRCGNCALWEARGAIRARMAEQPTGLGQAYLGTCQLYPPEIVVLRNRDGAEEVASVWPETHADRWCFEWTDPTDIGPDGGQREPQERSNVVHAHFRPRPRSAALVAPDGAVAAISQEKRR